MFTRTQKKEKRKEKKSAAMTSRKIEEDMAQKLSREAKNTLGHNKDSLTHTHTHTHFALRQFFGGIAVLQTEVTFLDVALEARLD